MMDIAGFQNGDLLILNTQTTRAKNILTTQLGSLEYAPELGPDHRYFLTENFHVQDESYKAYLIEVLANHGINVVSVNEVVDDLVTQMQINLAPEESSTGLIAR